MHDITCPYCEHEYDHDRDCDFEGLSSNNKLVECCAKCEKEFYVYVEFYPSFSDACKAPCLNGEPCEFKLLWDWGKGVTTHKCKHCDRYERREKKELDIKR